MGEPPSKTRSKSRARGAPPARAAKARVEKPRETVPGEAVNHAKKAPVRRPKQARSRETERALLDATERLLRTKGVAGVTTTEAAKQAGVGVGSVYEYFTSREALIYAVEHRNWMRVAQAVVARAMEMRGRPIQETIEAVVKVAMNESLALSGLHGMTAPTATPQAARVEMLDNLGAFLVEAMGPSAA